MYGVNWCPWDQKQPGFLTMAKMEPVICQLHGEPQYLGVALNGASCEVVGKLGRTMDNTCYLVHCHNTKQLNKNSFGLVSTQPLSIPLLNAGQILDISLPMSCTGAVQKMDPFNNIQVAIRNSIDIFYFACIAPLHIFFCEDGVMEKKAFLDTWKDIPAGNETQYTIEDVECTSDGIYPKQMSLFRL